MHLYRIPRASVALSVLLACPSLFAQTFTFAPPKNIPVPLVWSYNVIEPMDLNGDGKTDLALVLDANNYALLGDGKGGFSNTLVPLNGLNGLFPNQYFDVNGDGLADQVLAYAGNYDPTGKENYDGEFAVALGNGKGGFTTTTSIYLPATGDGFGFLVAGDFNRDGKLDFALIDVNEESGENTMQVFLNTGGGHFKFGEDVPLGHTSYAQAVVGDFNGDGKLDVAYTNPGNEGSAKNRYGIHYLYGNGDGSFQPDREYIVDGLPWGLATADLDHNGKSDLVAGLSAKLDANGRPVPGAKPRIATLLAKASGGFYWSSAVPWPELPENLFLADFNGDGLYDLVVEGNIPTPILPGKPGGRFGAPQNLPATDYPTWASPLIKGGLPNLYDILYTKGGSEVQVFTNTSKK